MMNTVAIAVFEQKNRLRINNRLLRDTMNPFTIPEDRYLLLYAFSVPPHIIYYFQIQRNIPIDSRVGHWVPKWTAKRYSRPVRWDQPMGNSIPLESKEIVMLQQIIFTYISHLVPCCAKFLCKWLLPTTHWWTCV